MFNSIADNVQERNLQLEDRLVKKKKKVAIYPHTKRGGDVGCGKESMRFRRQSQRIQHTCLEVPEVVEREKMENI